MNEHPVERRWPVTPRLNIAVEDSGQVIIEVTSPAGRAALPNIQNVREALSAAHFYSLVVHSPSYPGRTDLGPGSREAAFDLVEADLGGLPPVAASEHIDRFLTEFAHSGYSDMNLFYAGQWRWMPDENDDYGRLWITEGAIPTDADIGERS